MTVRLAARLVLAGTLLIPSALSAQGPPLAPHVTPPTNLSLTVDPVAPQPAQLRYLGTGETISADARAMKVTYTATGLEVEMTSGSVTITPTGKDPVPCAFDLFQLKLSGGTMISWKITVPPRKVRH